MLRHAADALVLAGDLALFALSLSWGVLTRAGRGTYVPIFYEVGVGSVPVVSLTGLFIGMVLAIESFSQFEEFGVATRVGQLVNVSVVRQLGPVLAGVMLAGRVGGAMAAELASMRISDQVDALAALGVHPVRHLGAPRLLACVLLIPVLTVVADFMGVLGGHLICVHLFGVDRHFYWANAQGHVGLFDVAAGLVKPTVFGAAIAVISCHRGLNSEPGAQGVGKAATSAFVWSFVAILVLNFFLAVAFSGVYEYLWPAPKGAL
jgi:phospholipid/cholesterol/gamma-HCH transport system permease protein